MSEATAIQQLRNEGAKCVRLAEHLARQAENPNLPRRASQIMRLQADDLMKHAMACAVLISHLMSPNRVAN